MSGAGAATYVALLRAINVGGHKMVAMGDLRALLADLGFENAQSLLQSGNLVFRGNARPDAQIERLLERAAGQRLGLHTDFFVRRSRAWEAVVGRNPFPEEATRDPGHLVVMFLKAAPRAKDVTALQAAITGPEVVRAAGQHVYITYPDGIGRSRVTTAVLEKHLGARGTSRNWNTVLKLAARASA